MPLVQGAFERDFLEFVKVGIDANPGIFRAAVAGRHNFAANRAAHQAAVLCRLHADCGFKRLFNSAVHLEFPDRIQPDFLIGQVETFAVRWQIVD